jgi:hypothetical protein
MYVCVCHVCVYAMYVCVYACMCVYDMYVCMYACMYQVAGSSSRSSVVASSSVSLSASAVVEVRHGLAEFPPRGRSAVDT